MTRRTRALASLAFVLTGCAARAAAPAPTAPAPTAVAPPRVHVLPSGWEESYDDWHYTPALRVGDTVIVSGIPASRGDTYDAKVTWMFEQLRAHLEAAGASLDDVVELTTFHAGATDTATFQTEFAAFSKIHHTFFPKHYPAWTAVGTTALLAKGAPVEMRAVAIVGSGAAATVKRAQP